MKGERLRLPRENEEAYQSDGKGPATDWSVPGWEFVNKDDPKERSATVHDPVFFGDGRFKFVTHGRKDRCDQPCIEDYADKKGREEWPYYYVSQDGSVEGPRPFRSAAEQRSYEHLTGLRVREPGERVVSKREKLETRVRELKQRLGER